MNRSIYQQNGAVQIQNDLVARQSVLSEKTGSIMWVGEEVNVAGYGGVVLQKVREMGFPTGLKE